MMIRSCRIPAILSRICNEDNNVIQTAMLVTNDGELLGSTSATFVNPEGVRESIENLGTLIADIAVDYQRLGDEFAGLDGSGQPASSQQHHLYDIQDHQQPPQPLVPTQPSSAAWNSNSASTSNSSNTSGGGGGGNNNNNNSIVPGGTNAGTTTKKASHLQFLLLELEQGLIGVSTCVGIDCMVIAIAGSLDAPPGMIKASLLSMAEHVQEGLSPLTETVSSYR